MAGAPRGRNPSLKSALARAYEQLHNSGDVSAASAFSAHAWQRPVMARTCRSPALAVAPQSEHRVSKLRAFAFQSSQDMISPNLAWATSILRLLCAAQRKPDANHEVGSVR